MKGLGWIGKRRIRWNQTFRCSRFSPTERVTLREGARASQKGCCCPPSCGHIAV